MKFLTSRRTLSQASAVVLSLAWLAIFGCGKPIATHSHLDTTDVQHTAVKRQAIGNCWLYATATWAESLAFTETGTEHNLSESYWTYWHWYLEIPSSSSRLNTGGRWTTASEIIQSHGWMEEGDFIPGEAEQEMSSTQARAEIYVNEQLAAGGLLEKSENRTPENIRKVLDAAFGVNMSEIESKIHPARELEIGHSADGTKITLDQIISTSTAQEKWQEIYYPGVYGQGNVASHRVQKDRREMLIRVMRALNDRKPVFLSVDIDFNALKTSPYATFDLETLKAAGRMGRQGGHLVVLEDYTVRNVPNVGEIGEGDVSDELKQAALLGEVTSLKAKNSWGTKRPERGLIDGYTSFKIDYLNESLPWKIDENSRENDVYWTNALKGFILPPGY